MTRRAHIAAGFAIALALAAGSATSARAQTFKLSDPFLRPIVESDAGLPTAPLPKPIVGYLDEEAPEPDEGDEQQVSFASFQPTTPSRSNNQSSSANSVNAADAAEPSSSAAGTNKRPPARSNNQSSSANSVNATDAAEPSSSAAGTNAQPPARSSNQSSSANSVNAADAAEGQTGAGPALQPAPGGDDPYYPAGSGQPNKGFFGADSPDNAEKLHPSMDELGTVRLPKEKPRPYKRDMPPKNRKVEAEFGDGLTARTADGYFSLTFHNLTQVDYRNFDPTGNILTDNFLIPRQRWYVLGDVSPHARYYVVLNRGYNSIDLLDAFIDLNFGWFDRDKFQLRVGRMKTPYTYEYIKISENDLIAPERSVFVGNLAPNREIGAMAHGQLLDKRFEYAVGLFNGPRRSFIDTNNQKDPFFFFNSKPFLKTKSPLLQQLNIGGSFNFGYEYNVVQPAVFRTASDQSTGTTANEVSPTFLQFNNNIFEQGLRMQWSGDVAWYYKSLAIMAGYQGGFQNYGVASAAIPSSFPAGVTSERTVKVPMEGWEATMFYFVTGEEITRRVYLLEPRNEFKGLRGSGTGAFECFTRVANMELGDSIFTGGLANSKLYTNRLNVLDNGVNWYLNHYTKLTFDWQYSQYFNPVELATNKFTKHQNIWWLRAQLFF